MNMCSWGLRCASDSELAAAKVKQSVAIRVTSPGYLQLVSTRRPLHRLLRICKAYDVVADIWVSIETGDLATTCKFVDSEGGVLFRAERLLIGMQRPSQSLESSRPSPCSNQRFQQPQQQSMMFDYPAHADGRSGNINAFSCGLA